MKHEAMMDLRVWRSPEFALFGSVAGTASGMVVEVYETLWEELGRPDKIKVTVEVDED
jgi:hypothetical protein